MNLLFPFQFPDIMSYCMSKAAIDQFTKCTALGKYLQDFHIKHKIGPKSALNNKQVWNNMYTIFVRISAQTPNYITPLPPFFLEKCWKGQVSGHSFLALWTSPTFPRKRKCFFTFSFTWYKYGPYIVLIFSCLNALHYQSSTILISSWRALSQRSNQAWRNKRHKSAKRSSS